MSQAFTRSFMFGTGLRLFAAVVITAPLTTFADNTAVNVSAAIEQVYRPAHENLATQSESLATSVDALCQALRNGSDDTNNDSSATSAPGLTPLNALDRTREHFGQTVDAFSRIELLRVGPLLDDNRLNRLFYWPDSRRVTERQLRQQLALVNVESLADEPQDISGKSVAVQGLPALERLLYTTVLTDVSTSLGGCALARDIAHNIHALAESLVNAWNSDTGISETLLTPSTASGLYRNQREVTRSLLTQVSAGLELIASRKAQPLSEDGMRLRNAPFGRSALTQNNLRGNLDSMQALLEASGMNQRGNVQGQLDFEFRIARGHLDSLASLERLSDGAGFVTAAAAELFRALQSVVTSIAFTTDDRISLALGVSAGFNSSDGD